MQMVPTRVRTFSLGVNNAMSRVGALLSPFLAVDLVARGGPSSAELVLAVCCLLAASATAALPLETSGKALLVCHSQFCVDIIHCKTNILFMTSLE